MCRRRPPSSPRSGANWRRWLPRAALRTRRRSTPSSRACAPPPQKFAPRVRKRALALRARVGQSSRMAKHILAIDQGTTSTRAIVFDLAFKPRATAQIELTQHYPQPGWVEHDAEEIWAATLKVCRDAIAQVGGADEIAAIGITNQRETTLIWDRATGAPAHKAIVWQDRRTADVCAGLREAGHEAEV